MTSSADTARKEWVGGVPIGAGSCASWSCRRQIPRARLREAFEFLLRVVGRHEGVDDLDEALTSHWPVDSPQCMQAGCFKLALFVGMQEETMMKHQAQAHAMACALVARLLVD